MLALAEEQGEQKRTLGGGGGYRGRRKDDQKLNREQVGLLETRKKTN